jgi:hypothetical protein
MSAYMVDDKTINRIVSYLYQEQDSHWTRGRLARECGVPMIAGGPELGALMFALNIQGVNARYGDGEASNFRPLDYQYEYELCTKMQALKSLQCWRYQCSEGDVPETVLYKIMDDYSHRLAESIVDALPAYEKAEWA